MASKTKEKPAEKKLPTKKVRQRNQVKKGTHGGTVLVLLEDVLHLGKQGHVVEVKPGYARNYLVPNGLAVVPTEHNLRLVERYKIKVHQAREAKIADLKNLAEQIKQISVVIEENAEEGHLYGSVGGPEISQALKTKGLEVEAGQIKLEAPIKECGVYEVKLSLGYEIESQVQVAVLPKEEKK